VVRAALARATRGLVTGNATLCGAVVAGEDEVDGQYLDIERQVIDLLGRHAPVASDLRLLTARSAGSRKRPVTIGTSDPRGWARRSATVPGQRQRRHQ
jgi:phosphate uptake regulator